LTNKDYFIHDKVYMKRKEEGLPGWDTEIVFNEQILILEESLQSNYVPRSGKLLELGCGAGDISLWFAEKGFDVFGIDISPTAIEWAQNKARMRNVKADFKVGNVLDMKEYPDDFFDFVLDGHCLHCIIGEDRRVFLSEANRVLKPKGFFHVRTMCDRVTDDETRKLFNPNSRCLVKNGIALRYIGLKDDILLEIVQAGFRILNWRWEDQPPIIKNTILIDTTTTKQCS